MKFILSCRCLFTLFWLQWIGLTDLQKGEGPIVLGSKSCFVKVRASYRRPYMYVILSPNHTVNILQCRMSIKKKKQHRTPTGTHRVDQLKTSNTLHTDLPIFLNRSHFQACHSSPSRCCSKLSRPNCTKAHTSVSKPERLC